MDEWMNEESFVLGRNTPLLEPHRYAEDALGAKRACATNLKEGSQTNFPECNSRIEDVA